MDTTALLVKLLPSCMLPKLKFVVTVLGGAASYVLATYYPGADHRYVLAAAALTAIGTYLTPNVQPVKLTTTVAESVDPETEWIKYGSDHPDAPVPATPVAATSTPVTEAPAAAPVVHEIGV